MGHGKLLYAWIAEVLLEAMLKTLRNLKIGLKFLMRICKIRLVQLL